MRFTQDVTGSVNVIRAYAPGELRINDAVYTEAVLLSPTRLERQDGIGSVADLKRDHAAIIRSFEPEVVLLGTGDRQIFPEPAFGALLLEAGIGFEVMDTGAACRTFNVLVGEHRQVVALLMV